MVYLKMGEMQTIEINKEIEELISHCEKKIKRYITLAEFSLLTDFNLGQRDAYADILNKLKNLQNGTT